MKHVFGPVPSRRLGLSLGIDLVPFKTCSFDCIYCQLGRTTCKTVQRREWLTWEPVLDELRQCLDDRPDYITLSGSGEPTLHVGLGELIDRVKCITDTPVAVLTNGSLLWRQDVRRDLLHADLVIPSLDVGDECCLRQVNRPHESLSFERIVEGLIAFREEYRGAYWLEVLVVAPWTAQLERVESIAAWVRRIRPDRVQLNTVTRPPAETFAKPVPRERLVELAKLFDPSAEVVDDYGQSPPNERPDFSADRILVMLSRRPCTIEDMMAAHGFHRNEVIKHLDHLSRNGLIESVAVGPDIYYRAVRPPRA